MASTYSPNLAIQLPATGDQSGQWGNTTNINLGTLIESAISGYVTQTFADANISLPMPLGANGGSGSASSPVAARNMFIVCAGTNTAVRTLTLPANPKIYFINNNTNGGFALTIACAGGGTTVSVANNATVMLACDGTNIITTLNNFPVLLGPTLLDGPTGTIPLEVTQSGNYCALFYGANVANSSYGIHIKAGTGQNDYPLLITNGGGTVNMWAFFGDGSITDSANFSSPQGPGTINLSGAYVNGSQLVTISGAVATFAPLNNPVFSGIATVPTGNIILNDLQIANTAAVYAYAAPLASPVLTGTPKAPTATAGTNTTQIATTQFVQAALPSTTSSLTTNGYDISPSGRYTFWGTATGTNPISVSFSSILAGGFPTACFNVTVTNDNNSGSYAITTVSSVSTTGFTLNTNAGSSLSYFWQAIGH